MATYYVSKDLITYPITDFSTISSAIAGIQNDDIIEILDSEDYSENFPANVSINDFTIRGANDNPNDFPNIQFLNDTTTYLSWWTNSGGNVKFEKVHITEFNLAYLNNNGKSLTLDKCCIQHLTSTQHLIEVANFNDSDAIIITNCLFNTAKAGSNFLIYLNNNQNLNGRLAKICNNSFSGNTTTQLIGSTGTNNDSILDFSNNIFFDIDTNNVNFVDKPNSRNNYFDDNSYTGWGEFTTNPQQYGNSSPFLIEPPVDCNDYKLSINMNITYLTDAPVDDLSSATRSITSPTVGAWEYETTPIVNGNRFRCHCS